MNRNKTKIMIIAVLATIIAGGAIVISCKKDESLTAKTENVSAVKEQKYLNWDVCVMQFNPITGVPGRFVYIYTDPPAPFCPGDYPGARIGFWSNGVWKWLTVGGGDYGSPNPNFSSNGSGQGVKFSNGEYYILTSQELLSNMLSLSVGERKTVVTSYYEENGYGTFDDELESAFEKVISGIYSISSVEEGYSYKDNVRTYEYSIQFTSPTGVFSDKMLFSYYEE